MHVAHSLVSLCPSSGWDSTSAGKLSEQLSSGMSWFKDKSYTQHFSQSSRITTTPIAALASALWLNCSDSWCNSLCKLTIIDHPFDLMIIDGNFQRFHKNVCLRWFFNNDGRAIEKSRIYCERRYLNNQFCPYSMKKKTQLECTLCHLFMIVLLFTGWSIPLSLQLYWKPVFIMIYEAKVVNELLINVSFREDFVFLLLNSHFFFNFF